MEAETPGAEAAPAPGENVDVVQEILESMLSKKNLVRDQFVAGNMNPQMYIPIQTLLEHERLSSIGATEAAVAAAAARSTKLGIDEKRTMVRPMLKSKRNVIILRDLPAGTTEEEIRALLTGAPHTERLDSVRPEVNNTWFVKFKLDDVADVVLWLRSQRLQGQPINAAIKSEHFLRSFFPLHLAGQGPPPPEMMGGMPGMPPMGPDGLPPQGFDPTALPPWVNEADFSGMGPPPMMPHETLQLPGFWQPWGERHQAPPLIFDSAITLAPDSAAAHMQEAAELEQAVVDFSLDGDGEEDFFKGEGKGKGDAKGRGKGKGEKGKGYYGAESGGKGAYAMQDGGGGASRRGGVDWYAASSGGKAGGEWEAAPARGRKGGKGEKGDAGAAPKGEERQKRGAQARPRGGDAAAPPPLPTGATASGYEHDFRRYSREDFESIGREMAAQGLARPEALDALGSDFPILREEPSVEFASVPAAA